MDLEGYRPEAGKRDQEGNEVPDRVYNTKDFDKNLVIDERTKMVAKKVTEYLTKTNRFDKTIIFCIDVEHASRMRQAIINENADLVRENSKYVMRITGDDIEGKRELDNFINPEEKYPVIVTTSKLMTTGVDAQTCKLIVLDSNIRSMTEFKQIIGRGTRIREDFNKTFFTIMDFRNVTDQFANPSFDGYPVMIKRITAEQPLTDEIINDTDTPAIDPETGKAIDFEPKSVTYTIRPEIIQGGLIMPDSSSKVYIAGVDVSVLNERVQHLDQNGKLIIESLKDFTKKSILKEFRSLEDFLARWNSTTKKKAIIDELESHGVILENLKEDVEKDLDVFDLVCHVAWDMPALTRHERAGNVKKRSYFTKYGEKARIVIDALLDKYADEGIENIEDLSVLKIDPFSHIGTPTEIVNIFGGRDAYMNVIKELETQLYRTA